MIRALLYVLEYHYYNDLSPQCSVLWTLSLFATAAVMAVGRSILSTWLLFFLSYFNPILSSWLLFLFHIIPEPTDRPALVFSGCFKAGTQKQPGQGTFEQWHNNVLSSPQSSYWVLNLVWFSISRQWLSDPQWLSDQIIRLWLSDPQCPDGESRGDGGGACRPEEKCRGESKNYGKVSIFSDIWNIKFENVWTSKSWL